MADQSHLKVLKMGVERWNQWRQEHPDIRPDLTGAMLNGNYRQRTDLARIDFTNTFLEGAKLVFAHLTDARLNGASLANADLSEASLSRADLSYANLSGAKLIGVNFSVANLTGADLTGARIHYADFTWAKLREAHLTRAEIDGCIFGDMDLSQVRGLDTVIHRRSSTVGVDTIVRSAGNIPEIFMRGTGMPEPFITYARSLINHPIDFYSCFISYSNHDQAFAERLYIDLQNKGVRCWFAPEDLKIGDHYHQRIDESIRLYDKLVLVLSEHAIQSSWVEREAVAAREKEDREQRTVLFPIRLDNAIIDTTRAWAADVRRRWHIGDFTQWKDHDAYQQAFGRLLRDLEKANEQQGQETKP